MLKVIKKTIKATIFNLIVALFIIILILFIADLFFRAKISEAVSLANKISINIDEKEEEKEIEISEKNEIKNYPEYGTKYANIEIPAIDVDLPVYYGDTLEILKNGVGHSSGSFFPGEGGSIIFMGHNSKKIFRRFSELKIGDRITVKATYGTYEYNIYNMKLINETDLDELPIQDEKEILMVYTCYPFNNIGYATQRYVVYAERVNQNIK